MAASTPKRKPSTRMRSVSQELGAIHEWMKDHEKHDDRRFEEGRRKMDTLATKDDIATVMVDQASKSDMVRLGRLLLDEEGQPKFATKEDMRPVLDLYKGSTFVRSFLAGGATLIVTLAAVGYAVYRFINLLRGHPH